MATCRAAFSGLLLDPASSTVQRNYAALLRSQGRLAEATLLLASAEFRALAVRRLYTELLHRPGSDADVAFWIGTGQDVLTLRVSFAATPEFQSNG